MTRFDAALDSLAWRGPDARRAMTVGGEWRIGVARLAITDPTADQPVQCPRTGRVIALNGAVTSAGREWPKYRRVALTRNDAELILLRLEDRGANSLGDMSGPYAFAIVEPDGSLCLGRDPEGEKPLYVARLFGRIVAFASTVAALRELGIGIELDPLERSRFLQFGFHRDPIGTSAVTVGSLPPGIWSAPNDEQEHRIPTPGRFSDQGLDHTLRAAVERCATAEVPVGLTLSGGIDSACIAACAEGRSLPAYQFRAVGEPQEERDRAALIARRFGHELHEVDGTPDILRALPELTRCVGLPLGDPSVLAAAAVARAAAADGVRVLLSGEGADELMLGYRRHRVAAYLPRRGWRVIPSPPAFSMSGSARVLRAFGAPGHPYDELLRISPPGFRRTALYGVSAERVDFPGIPKELPSLERARELDPRFYLRRDLLPKLDAATMSAAIEGRCPYLDPEVLASSALQERNARRALGKRALRVAFVDHLPPGFFRQRKTGFAIPIDRWIREDTFIADILTDHRTMGRPHVEAKGLAHALDLHRSGGAQLGHALYAVAALELYDRMLEERME